MLTSAVVEPHNTHNLSIVNRVAHQPLSPTGYALLGLLAKRPFSAYELTKHMKRSALAQLWPRTETSIYREPKILLARGFATATAEEHAGRSRTVYSITPAGRRALAAWLREPGGPFTFECEAAVKAFFADDADLDALRANLQLLADQPTQLPIPPVPAIESWIEGRMPFPERVQYTAMAADLIARVSMAVSSWAREWLELTEAWKGTTLHAASERQARMVLERVLAETTAHLAAGGPPG